MGITQLYPDFEKTKENGTPQELASDVFPGENTSDTFSQVDMPWGGTLYYNYGRFSTGAAEPDRGAGPGNQEDDRGREVLRGRPPSVALRHQRPLQGAGQHLPSPSRNVRARLPQRGEQERQGAEDSRNPGADRQVQETIGDTLWKTYY